MSFRHEKLLARDDGTKIRLVLIYGPTGIATCGVDVFALVMAPNESSWRVVNYERTPDKSLGGLSVDDYVKHGRKGLLAFVRPHEIFRAQQELDAKLRQLAA